MKPLEIQKVVKYVEENIAAFHIKRIESINKLKLSQVLKRKNPYLFKGIDLEFDKDNIRYIVTIKSGSNWGNSSQIKKMLSDFKTAKRTLRTSNSQINVVAINGCCYGVDKNPDKGEYFKYCGQEFWYFISEEENLYTELIEPLGYKAREKNEDFMLSYTQMINKFTREFSNSFCKKNGDIDWMKLVEFNSKNK